MVTPGELERAIEGDEPFYLRKGDGDDTRYGRIRPTRIEVRENGTVHLIAEDTECVAPLEYFEVDPPPDERVTDPDGPEPKTDRE